MSTYKVSQLNSTNEDSEMTEVKSTQSLIKERAILSKRIDEIDEILRNRKESEVFNVMSDNLAKLFAADPIDGITHLKECLDFITKKFTDGNPRVRQIDGATINAFVYKSEITHSEVAKVLDALVDCGYLTKTVWVWVEPQALHVQVSMDDYKEMLDSLKLGVVFPYNIATGEDIDVELGEDPMNVVLENYIFIWQPDVKYREMYLTLNAQHIGDKNNAY